MSRKSKVLIVVLGIILLGLLIVLVVATTPKKGNVEVSTSPIKTTITINGKEYNVSKTLIINLEPGEYTAEVSADNFSTEKITFTVKDKDRLSSYGVLLYPSNEEGNKKLQEKDEQEWRDIVGQLNAVNQSDRLFGENPLFSYLPYSEADFRVDYGIEGEGFIVWITADTQDATSKARQWIASVDSTKSYTIKTRTFAQSPLQVNRSESWEPVGKDVSDQDISGSDTQLYID